MRAGHVEGRAMTYAQRVEYMRAWFQNGFRRREFRVFDLPRLAPIQLGALAQVIGWRVTKAHVAQSRAHDALWKYVRESGDERLQSLLEDYFRAGCEVEHREAAIQFLERAELDYLRGVVWPGGEAQRQALPSECDRLHEWFRE